MDALTRDEQEAILAIALCAAFADGAKDERERAAVREVAEALDAAGGLNLAAQYRQVLLARPDPGALAARLRSPGARTLAYEMAVGVCDADGVQGPEERAFLSTLATALALPREQAEAASRAADAIAADIDFLPGPDADAGPAAPQARSAAPAVMAAASAAAATAAAAYAATAAATPASGTSAPAAPAAQPDGARPSSYTREELDRLVLDAAITNAALELLPESLSTLAIIPLQVRLVYRIGRSCGYPMDASQAKDFLATVGVGLGSQYLEQAGRKLLGGLLGGVLGGLGRTVGRQAASSGMSFATTWALGRLAERYYTGGRRMDTAVLKEAFRGLLEEARVLAPRHAGAIEQRAATLDPREILALVRR